MTGQSISDDLEIDVVQLIDRIKLADSVDTWPMSGALIVRNRDEIRGRVVEFSKDGNSLRVMVEFDGQQPSLYKLGSSVFSRVIVLPECDIPLYFADLAERPSDRFRRELEKQRRAQHLKEQEERNRQEWDAENRRRLKERADEHAQNLLKLEAIRTRIKRLSVLDDADIEFLKSIHELELIAEHHENGFHANECFATAERARNEWEKIERFDRSFMVLEMAIHTVWGERNIRLWTMRGATLRRLGEWDLAEASCRQAISLNPNSFHPYNALGGIYYDQGLQSKADEYFDKAVSLGASPQSQKTRPGGDATKMAAQRRAILEFLKTIK